ncbi:MAG: DegT/DnrJ/EryC1/StrS family aminotransferase [Candidatus Bathyarchaeia archaeon]
MRVIKINEPCIGEEEIESVINVLKSGILSNRNGSGPIVSNFERNFAKYVQAKYAVAFCSGTAALHAALLSIGVKANNDVIVPAFTFSATANSVVLAGAKPVFADIDESTYCVTSESIQRVITRKTKAIIPVHLYGLPVDLDPIIEMARKYDAYVIEDAAQAHGAMYKEKMIGCIGDLTCFSFYAGKNMTTGEGGIVTTKDEELYSNLRTIRSHGEEKPYRVTRLGHNYRMPELSAAVGLAQLNKLPDFLKRRRKNARLLTEALSPLKKFILPTEPEGRKHSWYLYTVRLKGVNVAKRNKVVEKLRAKGIEASVYYESPVHLLPFYEEKFGYKKGMYPESEKASRQVFSLPIHPKVSDEDVEYMEETLKKILKT